MSGYQGPGRYRHYKGGEYEVIALACLERSTELDCFDPSQAEWQMVVYRPLTPGGMLDGTATEVWIRPRRDFDAMVEREHGLVPRFVRAAASVGGDESMTNDGLDCDYYVLRRADLVDLAWRTGRKVGRTLYVQFGPEPSDDDELIGMMDTRILAQAAVDGHNAALQERSSSSDEGPICHG